LNASSPIDRLWQTALVLLPLCAGSIVSARQHTLEHLDVLGVSARLSGELTVMLEEWCAVLLLWLVLRRRGLSIGQLVGGHRRGLHGFLTDVGLAFAFTVVALVAMGLSARLLHLAGGAGSFEPKAPLEAILWIPVSATAGFCEELIFRGYLFAEFKAWTGSATLSLILQGIAFGLAHGYESSYMIVVAIYGWLLGALALWRKSLRPGMLAHGLQDASLGLLSFFLVH